MARLEELASGASVRGLAPEGLATVASVSWFGDQAVEVIYTQALVSVMWDQWNTVFKHVLGEAERTLVKELRELHSEVRSSMGTLRRCRKSSGGSMGRWI